MNMMQDQQHYRMQQPASGIAYGTGAPSGVMYQGQPHPPSGYEGQQFGPGQTTVYYQPTEDPTFYQVRNGCNENMDACKYENRDASR